MRRLTVLLVICLWSMSAYAKLYVEIRGGQVSGIPIAVVPFGGDKGRGNEIADVIRADLGNSGQFASLSERDMASFPSDLSEIQFNTWKRQGIEDLVIGRVTKTGSDYQVKFEVYDVIRQLSGSKTPILSMQFDNIQAKNFRALAHHISDKIFEKLVGVKGFFSTRIAYVSVKDGRKNPLYTLEVSDFDGYDPKPLFRSAYPIMSPAWSPDGKKIAFVSFEKDRAGIDIVEVHSAKVHRITQFPGINGAPSWSPDGRSLALVLSKDGSPKIYTLDIQSKKLTKLTQGTTRDTEPTYSPDGRHLYFTSDRGGQPQIYRLSLVTQQVDRVTFAGRYNAKPSLTPDGKRLITLHRGDNGLFSIAVQNLSSGDLKVISQTGYNDSPSVAPNGMMILYGSGDGGNEVLGAVSLDGRTHIRLPSHEGDVRDPAWSPFPTLR